jgi:hypothetical protein
MGDGNYSPAGNTECMGKDAKRVDSKLNHVFQKLAGKLAPANKKESLAAERPSPKKEKWQVKEWVWGGANDASAWLRTQQRGNTIKFDLELSRGAPSYNSGELSGEFSLNHRIGIYHSDQFGDCTIVFAFFEDTVQIEQLAGEGYVCGFGGGLVARYVLSPK